MSGALRKWPKRFQFDGDLTTEPETDKALRILRGLRHWLGMKGKNVTVIELDGQQIILIHVAVARAEGRLTADADTRPEVGA